MKNGWTGGQYSLYRMLLGIFLFGYFLHLIPWGEELFSGQGALSLSLDQHGSAFFPNPLAVWNSPPAVGLFLSLGAFLSLFLCAGLRDRWAALGLWYIWACLLDRNPLILNPHLPYIGWILLAHACLPTAPYGSWDARIRKDRGLSWELPQPLHGAAWGVMAWSYSYSGYWKMFTPAWRDGSALDWILRNPLSRDNSLAHAFLGLPSPFLKGLTFFVLLLEFLYGPLALWKRLRPWLWAAMLGVHLATLFLLDFYELTLGMILAHLFLFDPAWVKPKSVPHPVP
ncbi:MAG TPA: hypothetical protein VJ873_08310 [bacterium]|nr:hypothetical protein [bacterium]